jgi:hypothetical protein
MEELKRLFEFVDSKDKEISELYLKIIFDKYNLDVIQDYLFRNNSYVKVEQIFPGEYLINKRDMYIHYNSKTKEVSTKTW